MFFNKITKKLLFLTLLTSFFNYFGLNSNPRYKIYIYQPSQRIYLGLTKVSEHKSKIKIYDLIHTPFQVAENGRIAFDDLFNSVSYAIKHNQINDIRIKVITGKGKEKKAILDSKSIEFIKIFFKRNKLDFNYNNFLQFCQSTEFPHSRGSSSSSSSSSLEEDRPTSTASTSTSRPPFSRGASSSGQTEEEQFIPEGFVPDTEFPKFFPAPTTTTTASTSTSTSSSAQKQHTGKFFPRVNYFQEFFDFEEDKNPAHIKINLDKAHSFNPSERFELLSIRDLRGLTESRPPFKAKGKFEIITPTNPAEFNKYRVGRLQGLPEYSGYCFQRASTLSCLEGGVSEHNMVSGMAPHGVQGEEAAIGVVPAELIRLHEIPLHNRHTLTHLINLRKSFTDELKKIDLSDEDQFIQKNCVGLHRNVRVASIWHHGDRGHETDSIQKPLVFNQMLPSSQHQLVNHIMTSALDVSPRHHKGEELINAFKKHPERLELLANLILKAGYEGTIRAACYVGQPNIILTVVGGGAFGNDLNWIAEAIESIKEFIIEKNMQVNLICPAMGQISPELKKFIHRMQILSSEINARTVAK